MAVFTTTRTLSNSLTQVSGLLRAPLRPELARLAASDSNHTLARVFRYASVADTLMVGALLGFLSCTGPWIVETWSRGKVHVGPLFIQLMLAASAVELFLFGLGRVGIATNRLGAFSVARLASALISLALCLFLLPHFGLNALPSVSLTSAAVIMGPVVILDARRHAAVSLRFLLQRVLLPFLVTTCAVLAFSNLLSASAPLAQWSNGLLAGLTGLIVASTISTGAFSTAAGRRKCRNILSRNFGALPQTLAVGVTTPEVGPSSLELCEASAPLSLLATAITPVQIGRPLVAIVTTPNNVVPVSKPSTNCEPAKKALDGSSAH